MKIQRWKVVMVVFSAMVIGVCQAEESISDRFSIPLDVSPELDLTQKLNSILGDKQYQYVGAKVEATRFGDAMNVTFRGSDADAIQMALAFCACGVKVQTVVPSKAVPENGWRVQYMPIRWNDVTMFVTDHETEQKMQAALGAAPVPETKLKVVAFETKETSLKVTIENNTDSSFWVRGYGIDSAWLSFRSFDEETKTWIRGGGAYCGTGAGIHEVKPGAQFTASGYLSEEARERNLIATFIRYADPLGKNGIVEQTPERKGTL